MNEKIEVYDADGNPLDMDVIQKADWKERRNDYSDIWVLLLRNASLAFGVGNFVEYCRYVETLKTMLYPDMKKTLYDYLQQEKITEPGETIQEKVEYYTFIKEVIIEILQTKGIIGGKHLEEQENDQE